MRNTLIPFFILAAILISPACSNAQDINNVQIIDNATGIASKYEIHDSDKKLSKLFQRWAKEQHKTLVWESSTDVAIQEHDLWRKWSAIDTATSLDDAYNKILRIAPTMALRLDHSTEPNAINPRTRPLYLGLCKVNNEEYEYLIRGNLIPCHKKSPLNR